MSRVGARVEELRLGWGPDGRITVDGWMPGPAGVARVELLDATAELLLDVAEPDLLVALRLADARDPRARRLARVLLGPRAAEELARSRPHRSDESVVLWRRDDDANVRPIRRGSAPGGLGLIGRLGLALGEVAMPALAERAAAVGLVEAAVAVQDLAVDLDPHPPAVELLRAGVDRWAALPAASFDGLDPSIRGVLGRRVGRWQKQTRAIDPRLAGSLAPLLEQLDDVRDEGAVHAGGAPSDPFARGTMAGADEVLGDTFAVSAARSTLAAPGPVPASSPMGSSARHDVAVLLDGPLAAAGVRVIGVERAAHHLTVHLGGLPDDGPEPWVRVFAAGPRPTLVALAPVARTDRPWRSAVALIGPGIPTSDVLVDVTISPKEPWLGPSSRAVTVAAHLGAEAARAGRRGHDHLAAQGWQAAADAWEALGDDRRAALARGYRDEPPSVEPLAVDLLS